MNYRCLVAAATLAVAAATDGDKSCFLLGGDKADKPFPSLTQCYKQNQQACCVSAHDATIADTYSGILSGTCIREYSDLEQWYCFGCSPDSDSYITYYNETTTPATLGKGTYKKYIAYDGPIATQNCDNILSAPSNVLHCGDETKVTNMLKKGVPGKYGEIRICESFAKKLMYNEADTASLGNGVIDAYDGCGLTVGGDGDLSRTYFSLAGDEVTAADNAVGMTIKALVTAGGVSEFIAALAGGGDINSALASSGMTGTLGAASIADIVSKSGAGSDDAQAWLDTYSHSSSGADKFVISPEWKFFQTMRPPYFGADKFEVSWYHSGPAAGTDLASTCFGAASGLQVGAMAVAITAYVAHLLA